MAEPGLKSISDKFQSKHSSHNNTLLPRKWLKFHFLVRSSPLGSQSIWKVPGNPTHYAVLRLSVFSLASLNEREFLTQGSGLPFHLCIPILCLDVRTDGQVGEWMDAWMESEGTLLSLGSSLQEYGYLCKSLWGLGCLGPGPLSLSNQRAVAIPTLSPAPFILSTFF